MATLPPHLSHQQSQHSNNGYLPFCLISVCQVKVLTLVATGGGPIPETAKNMVLRFNFYANAVGMVDIIQGVLRIRITLMRIWILLFTLMRIRIQILPLTFSLIWTLQWSKMTLEGFHLFTSIRIPEPTFPFDADPTSHFDADPVPASLNDADPDTQHCYKIRS